MSTEQPDGRALALAYRYLNRRERTEREMRAYLERRGIDAAAEEQAVQALRAQGYLDDARFVRLFAQDKRTLEGWGHARIRRTLEARGIDTALIEDLLGSDPPADELDRALELLARRCASAPRTRAERDRALGMMLRRGYDPELAVEALAAFARAASESPLG